MSRPIRLYRHPLSGHAHRAELFLSLLALPFERAEVDLLAREQRSPAFLALNPLGQVPVIVDGDTVVADSGAILVYLALRHDRDRRWLPADPLAAARVQRWLSLAAGPLVQGPATARLAHVFGAKVDLERAQGTARDLFGFVERELSGRTWLAGDHPTLADVAMYTYTAHAPEGGVSLEPWPALRGWLRRVEELPGFVPMRATPVG